MRLFSIPKSGLCSIEIGPQGLAVAHCINPEKHEFRFCEFHPFQSPRTASIDGEQLRNILAQIISTHDLKHLPCNLVLHPDLYKIVMLATPNVAKTEYKKAIRWQLRDVIDYPLEDVAIDIFYATAGNVPPKKIYVIAVQRSWLRDIAFTIQSCELQLIAIDIRQFALRNLIYSDLNHQDNNKSVGILDLNNQNCVITIVNNHKLSLVRKFPTNGTQLQIGNHDELSEELQRSFDYCEAELEIMVPNKLLAIPHKILNSDLVKKLENSLNKIIEFINLDDFLKTSLPLNHGTDYQYHGAIGGALRNFPGDLSDSKY